MKPAQQKKGQRPNPTKQVAQTVVGGPGPGLFVRIAQRIHRVPGGCSTLILVWAFLFLWLIGLIDHGLPITTITWLLFVPMLAIWVLSMPGGAARRAARRAQRAQSKQRREDLIRTLRENKRLRTGGSGPLAGKDVDDKSRISGANR